jgi:hypothetical protein
MEVFHIVSNKTSKVKPVSLIKSDSKEISISLTATINSDGALVLEGQDLGPRVKAYWGDSDYEYWVTVPSARKPIVLRQLLLDSFPNIKKLYAWLSSTSVEFECDKEIRDEKFDIEINEAQITIQIEPKSPIIVINRKYSDKLVLQLLKHAFKQKLFNSDSEFMNWLKKYGIKYEFFSYG